jgi:hypothetical protein
MGGLVWVGFLAFFVVALVVGVRVLLLARRTHELPELLMGIGVLGIGPVGFGLMVAGGELEQPSIRTAILAVASFAVSAGVLAKFVFNWRVYHPDSGAVRALVVAAGVALVVCFAWMGIEQGFSLEHALSPPSLGRSCLQITCLLWGAGESFAYWMKMRRRVRLGLADPVVSNRFLMWAIGAFAAGWGTAVGTVAQLVTGATIIQGGWTMVSSSLHGLVAAVAIALAFIPPAFYVRYIRARAERDLAASFR